MSTSNQINSGVDINSSKISSNNLNGIKINS